VGDRLVGTRSLQLDHFRGDSSLAITAQPFAKVGNQPLHAELGQFEAGVEIETNRNRSDARHKVELATPGNRNPNSTHLDPIGTHRVTSGNQRKERREGHILSLAGLFDQFELGFEPWLTLKGLGHRFLQGEHPVGFKAVSYLAFPGLDGTGKRTRARVRTRFQQGFVAMLVGADLFGGRLDPIDDLDFDIQVAGMSATWQSHRHNPYGDDSPRSRRESAQPWGHCCSNHGVPKPNWASSLSNGGPPYLEKNPYRLPILKSSLPGRSKPGHG